MVVRSEDDGVHLGPVLRGGGEHDSLGSGVEMLAALLHGAVLAGGLDDDIDVVGAPVDVAGVGTVEHRDAAAVDHQVGSVELCGALETTEDRVELEEVHQGGTVGDVGDRGHFDARLLLELSEDVAADAAEAHQPHPNRIGHLVPS